MQYKTLNEFAEELHPWTEFIPPHADKLILGTFPTAEKNRGAYNFFYPNSSNEFWNIIFGIAHKEPDKYSSEDPIEARKQVLCELKLGIADMGKRVLRQNNSSKDESLFPIEYTDVFSLLEAYGQISKIIVTSSSGSNSVLAWFGHYCLINGVALKTPKGKLPKSTELVLGSRKIKVDIIPSSSSLAPIKGERRTQMYRTSILNQ